MLTRSDISDENGRPVIVTKQLPEKGNWIAIRGIYLTECIGAFYYQGRERLLEFTPQFCRGERPWLSRDGYCLEPDLESPLETVEYGDDFADSCQAHLPNTIRDLLERADVRPRAKSARS
jgi:hypothetical protein